MDMRKYAGETYIKVDDVRTGPLDLKVAVVKTGKFDKPDIIFETGEILTLNATNSKTLIRAYGPDSDDWVGKDIRLKLGKAPYQGETVDSVAIEPISPPITELDRAEAAAKLDSRNDDRGLNDEIAF